MGAIQGRGGIGQPRGLGKALFGLGLVVHSAVPALFSDLPPSLGVPEIVVFDDFLLPQTRPPIAHLVAGSDWQPLGVPRWLATVVGQWQIDPDTLPQPPSHPA